MAVVYIFNLARHTLPGARAQTMIQTQTQTQLHALKNRQKKGQHCDGRLGTDFFLLKF